MLVTMAEIKYIVRNSPHNVHDLRELIQIAFTLSMRRKFLRKLFQSKENVKLNFSLYKPSTSVILTMVKIEIRNQFTVSFIKLLSLSSKVIFICTLSSCESWASENYITLLSAGCPSVFSNQWCHRESGRKAREWARFTLNRVLLTVPVSIISEIAFHFSRNRYLRFHVFIIFFLQYCRSSFTCIPSEVPRWPVPPSQRPNSLGALFQVPEI